MQRKSLHLLRGTAIFTPGDTSVDTSYNKIQDEADLSEPREVKAVFGEIGIENQGAVGVPVPAEGDELENVEFEDTVHDVEYRYTDEPDAPEDAVGKSQRLFQVFCSSPRKFQGFNRKMHFIVSISSFSEIFSSLLL